MSDFAPTWVPEDVPLELALLVQSEPPKRRVELRREAQKARDKGEEFLVVILGRSAPRRIRTEPRLIIRAVNALKKGGVP